MASQFKTPVSFPDFDKLTYRASFDDEGRVVVKRLQGNLRRGKWLFEFSAGATGVCVSCNDPWVKLNLSHTYTPEFVPEPVTLKAKEFLAASIAVKGRPR